MLHFDPSYASLEQASVLSDRVTESRRTSNKWRSDYSHDTGRHQGECHLSNRASRRWNKLQILNDTAIEFWTALHTLGEVIPVSYTRRRLLMGSYTPVSSLVTWYSSWTWGIRTALHIPGGVKLYQRLRLLSRLSPSFTENTDRGFDVWFFPLWGAGSHVLI